GRIVFASEVKSLLLAPEMPRRVDIQALHSYMAFHWVPGPQTLFAGIEKLPPAHYMVWQAGRSKVHSYWDLRFGPLFGADEKELAAELRRILVRAVERHLIADVP